MGEYLDQDAVRAEVASPTYLAGLWERDDNALVDPARLAWGLADTAERLGVRIHEDTPVADLRAKTATAHDRPHDGRSHRRGPRGSRSAPMPSRRSCGACGWHTVPVYDYALMTEPLSADQLALGRLAPPAGHRRLRQPVPLLPAHARQPDPVGRVRRDLPLRSPALRPPRPAARRPSSCSRGSSSRLSRSWRACGSPISGAGPSTPARGSSPSTARRTPGARRTRSATPASVSARPASAPT